MFAYCGNSPVSRSDTGGNWWDTVLDVISLGCSIADVISNPNDPWAWVGLMGDIVDVVIPYVGGIGEVVDSIRIVDSVVDSVDDVIDVVKVSDDFDEAAEVIIETYEVRCPQQISMEEAVEMWDEFLGPNQTNYNRYTGQFDSNRIFSADGNRSIRLTDHEMDSFGTTKAHFHYEEWFYNSENNTVVIFNQLQRLK